MTRPGLMDQLASLSLHHSSVRNLVAGFLEQDLKHRHGITTVSVDDIELALRVLATGLETNARAVIAALSIMQGERDE